VLTAVEQVAQKLALSRRVVDLEHELEVARGGGAIVAESGPMRRVMRLLSQAIDSNATVLLLGESGTGKGLLASYLHRHGPRSEGPFIPLNCAAIPET